MNTREQKLEACGRLLDILDELREKCPWDKKQANESLRMQTIEETYELSEAIIKAEPSSIREELGDLFLHIAFYSKIGEEKGQFDFADVVNGLCDKLIYRHPHVFSTTQVADAEEVMKNWEQLKIAKKGEKRTVLGGVPKEFSSIIKAIRIQEKARGVGFDWEEKSDVWNKVREEMSELEVELKAMETESKVAELKSMEAEQQLKKVNLRSKSTVEKVKQRAEDELGDLLFAIINAARLYKLNPDNALESTCHKFIRRFNYIEEKAAEADKKLPEMSLEEMDLLWNEAKSLGY